MLNLCIGMPCLCHCVQACLVFAIVYRHALFMPGLHSLKISRKSNTKFAFKTMYFLGTRGLITSSYVVYGYPLVDNEIFSVCIMYIQYMYITYSAHNISVHYLFLMQ